MLRTSSEWIPWAGFLGLSVVVSGCESDSQFQRHRLHGQRELMSGNHWVARGLFHDAQRYQPSDPENLYDLGLCCESAARELIDKRNPMAADRELDRAVDYYERAITSLPGMQAALEGKNRALELRGQLQGALEEAHWATANVGPSAREYIFLASEYEERGDLDQALLRYRQAAAMEPDNAFAQQQLNEFQFRHSLSTTGGAKPTREASPEPPQEDPNEIRVAAKTGALKK